MPFVNDPVVFVDPDGVSFQLVRPAHYLGREDDWEIPVGFSTDFASIPDFVSWAIPKLGAYTDAAIVHDYFCRVGIEDGQISARDADAVFRRIMRETGVDLVTRWLVWTGVRWGALANPIRRPGWWNRQDTPLVLLITLLVGWVIIPTSVAAFVGRLLLQAASRVAALFSKGDT